MLSQMCYKNIDNNNYNGINFLINKYIKGISYDITLTFTFKILLAKAEIETIR